MFVFIVIGVVILNITYKNKTIKTNRKSNLAIMIKEDSGEYVSSNEIPKGNYVLNDAVLQLFDPAEFHALPLVPP